MTPPTCCMGGRVLVGGGLGVSDWGQRLSVEMLDVQPVESTRPWEHQHKPMVGKAGLGSKHPLWQFK